MIQRGQCPGFTREARQPVAITGEDLGKDLQRHIAIEPAVAGPIHLAHGTGPERREHFVGTETRARREAHERRCGY